MRDALQEVVSLQLQYSLAKTPAMQRRGILIRRTLPDELRAFGVHLNAAMGRYGDDADAQGKDNMGRMAWVPWVRWYSKSRSPRPTDGWYVVFLFHSDGSGVSLCLSHGSTHMKKGGFVKRATAEVAEKVSWGLEVVDRDFDDDSDVRRGIDLGKKGLGPAYERTTLFSKFYPSGAIPSDEEIEADLVRFVRSLAKLYEAVDRGGQPGTPSPEARALREEVERYIAPLSSASGGQGRGLPPEARRAVELAAMRRAEQWLQAQGFEFRDVSARDCCDFRAHRDGEEWVIEVKGTTGRPATVLLTPNEVELHRSRYPRNALLVVHGLTLSGGGTKASGGKLLALSPWKLDDRRLSSVCYEYRLG